MAHDVFVSYAEEDKATADAVVATLEQHQIRCWVAPRDVSPGKDYAASLVQAINSSRVLVLVFSSSANTSPHVMREIERAASKSIPILPLRIEDVSYSESMEYFISGTHWLDALTPPLKQHLERLARTVAALLGADDGSPGTDREHEAHVSSRTAEAAADAGMGRAPPSQGVLEVAKRWGGRSMVRLALGAGAIAVVTIILVALLSGGGGDGTDNGDTSAVDVVAPTATAAPTPLTEKIAFVSDRDGDPEIYVMNADGSSPVNITGHPANDAFPAWSPDGSRIAFVSDRDGDPEIYVMNADGSGQARLTFDPREDSAPAWSPDGSRIAYHIEADGEADIYVMNADGSAQDRLTDDPAFDAFPAWSPDGSRIAFLSDRDGGPQIWVMEADGSGETNISNDPDASDHEPAWSPDGTRIAFSRLGGWCNGLGSWMGIWGGSVGETIVMNADGSVQHGLTHAEQGACPAWSPDGSRIAFQSDRGESDRNGDFEIYVMYADDGELLKQLTDNTANDITPDWWSPPTEGSPTAPPSTTTQAQSPWIAVHFDQGGGAYHDGSVAVGDWPQGSTLTLDVYEILGGTLIYNEAVTSYDGSEYPFLLTLFHVVPANHVVVTDGTTTKDTVVTDLSVDAIDFDGDIVYGSASDPAAVEVFGEGDPPPQVTATRDGFAWDADFGAVGVDLHGGSDLAAWQYDADGDATTMNNHRVTEMLYGGAPLGAVAALLITPE